MPVLPTPALSVIIINMNDGGGDDVNDDDDDDDHLMKYVADLQWTTMGSSLGLICSLTKWTNLQTIKFSFSFLT